MNWANSPDTHNEAIASAISRNRFNEIFRYLHLADNASITNDRYYKVRSLFEILNTNFKQFDFFTNYSIDESIIPYYGKHGTKQFIRGKPIRFGFKLWSIASSDGYLVHAEPYCGSDTDLPVTGLGQGSDVVLGLIEKSKIEAGSAVIFDNLFTSLPLLDRLTDLQVGGLGTLRQNRFQGAPIATKATLDKKERGCYDYATDGNNLVVSWKDNKVVTTATNYVSCNPVGTAKRWSKAEKKKIDVPMPHPFKVYNHHMGGVDLFDQFISTYRVRIRSKKWWWPFLGWAINASMANAWNLYRKANDGKEHIGMLEFQREVAMALLAPCGRNKPSRLLPYPKNVAETVKLDTQNHILVRGMSKYCRCKQCGRRSIYLCQKCNVTLHPDCFKAYHSA